MTTENAWFAARPSGTEDVYKIYAESFEGPEHLKAVQAAAKRSSTRRSAERLEEDEPTRVESTPCWVDQGTRERESHAARGWGPA